MEPTHRMKGHEPIGGARGRSRPVLTGFVGLISHDNKPDLVDKSFERARRFRIAFEPAEHGKPGGDGLSEPARILDKSLLAFGQLPAKEVIHQQKGPEQEQSYPQK